MAEINVQVPLDSFLVISKLGNILLKAGGLSLAMKGNTFASCMLAKRCRVIVINLQSGRTPFI